MVRLLILSALLVAPLAAQAAERDRAERAADAPDKIICKRFAVTGSLAQTRRECRTKRDWERGREESERDYKTLNNGIGNPTPSG